MILKKELYQCQDCRRIFSLINKIDRKISHDAINLLLKSQYKISLKFSEKNFRRFIRFRTILMLKAHNPDYLPQIFISDIAGLIKKNL